MGSIPGTDYFLGGFKSFQGIYFLQQLLPAAFMRVCNAFTWFVCLNNFISIFVKYAICHFEMIMIRKSASSHSQDLIKGSLEILKNLQDFGGRLPVILKMDFPYSWF